MRYFCFDAVNNDFTTYATEAEAKAYAEECLDQEGTEAWELGWPYGTDKICWGEIKQISTKIPYPNSDQGEVCDYALTDIAPLATTT